MTSAITVIEQAVYSIEQTFSQVSVDKGIIFKKEAEFALQIISKSDYAMGIAARNLQSVRDAVVNLSAIGISLNPAKREAYLVPMDGAIQLQISWMGLVAMAVDSGAIAWAKAEVVRAKDHFVLNGLDKLPTHEFQPFDQDRGDIIGVYCVAKLPSGDYLTETMTIGEVFDIRDRTNAWKAWIAKKKKCPWVTDESEMVRKTCVKRAYKSWPRSDRLGKAVHFLNTDGGEGIDLGAGDSFDADGVSQAPAKFQVGPILANVAAAQNDDEISAARREGLTAASAARDKYAYDRIRAAVLKRRQELGIVIDVEAGAAQ